MFVRLVLCFCAESYKTVSESWQSLFEGWLLWMLFVCLWFQTWPRGLILRLRLNEDEMSSCHSGEIVPAVSSFHQRGGGVALVDGGGGWWLGGCVGVFGGWISRLCVGGPCTVKMRSEAWACTACCLLIILLITCNTEAGGADGWALTKQLNIQMIKKGGVALRTPGGKWITFS